MNLAELMTESAQRHGDHGVPRDHLGEEVGAAVVLKEGEDFAQRS